MWQQNKTHEEKSKNRIIVIKLNKMKQMHRRYQMMVSHMPNKECGGQIVGN